MASSSSTPTPTPPPWIVLGRIAEVRDPVGQGQGQGQGQGVTLTRLPPPQVSLLTVSPRLFPEAIGYRDPNNPSILAVDSSGGILLLHAILRRASASEPIVVDLPTRRYVLTTGLVASYLVVDTTANTACALPQPGILKDSSRVGILYYPSASYVVGELQLTESNSVLILFIDSNARQWSTKRVFFHSRSPLPPSRFNPDCVLSHDGKLWWVDLSCGLIAWDALKKLPLLTFFDLPPLKSLDLNRAETPDLGRHRCVAISNGKIRFVDMYSNNTDQNGRRMVSVWTLQPNQDPTWLREYEAIFEDIWSHRSYKLSPLPRTMPVLAFIHPRTPWIIYFFLHSHLFGIHLQQDILVECVRYQPEVPSSGLVSSRFFHAFGFMTRSSSSGTTGGVVASAGAVTTGGVAGSSGGVPQEFQREFPDKVFNELYGHWRQQGVIIDVNEFSGQNGQTIACASKALKDWNIRHDTSWELDLTESMDSHSFNGSQQHIQQSCFHVNFYAKSSENKKQLFFAELQGPDGPVNTITVMPLGQDEDAVKESSAEHICYCCSGLMHPYSKTFVGCKATATHQHQ